MWQERRCRVICIVFAVAGPTLVHAADEYVTACGHTRQPSCISGSTTCHQAVGGKCKLNSNLSCDATESPLMLDSGLDLDLRGYDITCTETLPSTCNYAAISFDPNDSGSVVTSDGTAGDSVISGPFYSGVNCDLAAGSVAENTTVFDALFGILDCKTVKNNVIGATTQNAFGGYWGIALTAQISSGDAITGNFVSGRVVPIAATHPSATVQGNVVDTDGAVLGISVGTSAGGYTGQARCNVFFGEGSTAHRMSSGSPARPVEPIPATSAIRIIRAARVASRTHAALRMSLHFPATD